MMNPEEFEGRWWSIRLESKPLLREGKLEEVLARYTPFVEANPGQLYYQPSLVTEVLNLALSLRKKEAIPSEKEQKALDSLALGLCEDDFIPAELPYVKEILHYYYPKDCESRYEDLIYGVERHLTSKKKGN